MTPSNIFNSAVVEVTPSIIFNSDVVAVTPSIMFSSVPVAVISVPPMFNVVVVVLPVTSIPPVLVANFSLPLKYNCASPVEPSHLTKVFVLLEPRALRIKSLF